MVAGDKVPHKKNKRKLIRVYIVEDTILNCLRHFS